MRQVPFRQACIYNRLYNIIFQLQRFTDVFSMLAYGIKLLLHRWIKRTVLVYLERHVVPVNIYCRMPGYR